MCLLTCGFECDLHLGILIVEQHEFAVNQTTSLPSKVSVVVRFVGCGSPSRKGSKFSQNPEWNLLSVSDFFFFLSSFKNDLMSQLLFLPGLSRCRPAVSSLMSQSFKTQPEVSSSPEPHDREGSRFHQQDRWHSTRDL